MKIEANHQHSHCNAPRKTDNHTPQASLRESVPGLRANPQENTDGVVHELSDILVPTAAPAYDNAANHSVGNCFEIAPSDRPHELIRPDTHRNHLAAVVLAAAVSLPHHHAFARGHAHANAHADSRVSCGVHTVSIVFFGSPGQVLRYADLSYEVPPSGRLELLAEPNIKTYQIDGLALPLAGTLDKFAALSVRLPEPSHEPVQQ
jgi:hypothetical protein